MELGIKHIVILYATTGSTAHIDFHFFRRFPETQTTTSTYQTTFGEIIDQLSIL